MELWILLPLISALLMASVNVVDKFFVLEGEDSLNFKSFCLYSGGMQIIIFLLLFLFSPLSFNKLISIDSALIIFSGIFFGLSLIFLVKAMDIEEISRVEPIYLIHTILVPLIGLSYLNENLSLDKYIGIILIFISSIFASIRWDKNIKAIDKTAISSLIIGGIFFAIASIIMKESIDKNLFTNPQILSLRALGLFFAAGIPFMNNKNFRNLSTFFAHKKRGTALFVFETIFPLVSMYLVVVSLNYIEVSIVNSFNGARPIFTILFSIFFAYILQRNTQEKVDPVNIFIKFVSGILALIGIILLA
tara:strand:- start:2905 stop:3819 length:915 start_codon:yes stop_codon:yes gene_type:complete